MNRFWIVDDIDPRADPADVTGWYGVVDELEGGIVAYASTLERAQRIRRTLQLTGETGAARDKCYHCGAAWFGLRDVNCAPICARCGARLSEQEDDCDCGDMACEHPSHRETDKQVQA